MKKLVIPFLDFMFVDKKTNGITINHETPVEKGVAYSGYDSYGSILEHNNKVYYYYRKINTKRLSNPYKHETTHVAVSDDRGMTFKNEKKIFKKVGISHNFCIVNKLIDGYFYGIGGIKSSVCSKKGIHLLHSKNNTDWEENQILTSSDSCNQDYYTYFDSLNNIMYDETTDEYVLYARYNKRAGDRRVQRCKSKDLKKWGKFEMCHFEYKPTNIYIPAVLKYPNSFFYISFSNYQSSANKKSNRVFFSLSLDGLYFNIINKSLASTQKLPHRPVASIIENGNFFNTYIDCFTEKKLRCYQYRKNGFTSIVTTSKDEEYFTLYPMKIEKYDMSINFKTESDGYVQMIMYTESNKVIRLSDKLTGNHIDLNISWKNIINTSDSVIIKFVFKKAKIYSISCCINPTIFKDVILINNSEKIEKIKEIIKKEAANPYRKPKRSNRLKKAKRKTKSNTSVPVNIINKNGSYLLSKEEIKQKNITFEYQDLTSKNKRKMTKEIPNTTFENIVGDVKYYTKTDLYLEHDTTGSTAKCNVKTGNGKIIELILVEKSNKPLYISNLKLNNNKVCFDFTYVRGGTKNVVKYINYFATSVEKVTYSSYNYHRPPINKKYTAANCGRHANCVLRMSNDVSTIINLVKNSKSNCVINNVKLV